MLLQDVEEEKDPAGVLLRLDPKDRPPVPDHRLEISGHLRPCAEPSPWLVLGVVFRDPQDRAHGHRLGPEDQLDFLLYKRSLPGRQ